MVFSFQGGRSRGLLIFVLMLAACAFAQDKEILNAMDLDALCGKVGEEVTVEGVVTGIEMTKSSSVTFINFDASKRKGFVAVIFQRNYDAFPDGLDQFRHQKVRVTGVIKIYRGKPEIVLTAQDQIALAPS